jgi:hypothetical protein
MGQLLFKVIGQHRFNTGSRQIRLGHEQATAYLDCGGVFALPPLLVIAAKR